MIVELQTTLGVNRVGRRLGCQAVVVAVDRQGVCVDLLKSYGAVGVDRVVQTALLLDELMDGALVRR